MFYRGHPELILECNVGLKTPTEWPIGNPNFMLTLSIHSERLLVKVNFRNSQKRLSTVQKSYNMYIMQRAACTGELHARLLTHLWLNILLPSLIARW